MRPVAGLAILALLLIPSVLSAHPRVQGAARAKAVRSVAIGATDHLPKVRIRGVEDPAGMTPLVFARWINRHPAVVASGGDHGLLLLASSTGLLNRTALSFAAADADGDGRVSAIELADFVARPRYSISTSLS
jgi:hypothetical protein